MSSHLLTACLPRDLTNLLKPQTNKIILNCRTLPYKTTLQLKNISNLPCTVSVKLADPSLFQSNKTMIQVHPDNTEAIEICTKPMRKGIMKSELSLSVKNNPQVYKLHLNVRTVPLDLEINPKVITFDKVSSVFQ